MAPEPADALQARSLLANGSFELPLKGERPPGWSGLFGVNVFGQELTLSDQRAHSGRWSLRIADRSHRQGVGLRSDPVPVEAGQLYLASVYAYNEEGVAQIYLEFWDASQKRLGVYIGTAAEQGRWALVTAGGRAPENARWATVLLYSHGNNTGVSYYDDVALETVTLALPERLTRMGEATPARPPQPGAAGAASPQGPPWPDSWPAHPRLYITGDELAGLRRQLATGEQSPLAAAAREVVEAARRYADETSFTVTYYGGYTVTFPLPPRQPEPIPDPPGFRAGRYPYWTMMSRAIQTRLETLALAYALTGDAVFGRRAAEWALAVAQWASWTDPTYPCNGRTCLDTAHLTLGVSAVYDLAHAALTPAEREALREALLQKGLAPLYADTGTPSDHNLHMLRTGALGVGALAVAGDGPAPDLPAFVQRARQNFLWFLDRRLGSGQTEGFTYASYALENVARLAVALRRAAGDDAFFRHPYLREVLPRWVTAFLAPGGRSLVPFSDANDTPGFFATFSALAGEGDPLAAWYLQEADPPTDAASRLLYSRPGPAPRRPDQLGLPRSQAFWDLGWVALRSGWGPDDVLLAFQSSRSALGHNQYDQNHIVLNVAGEWLLTDPGYPDYTPGPKNDVTKGTLGHNALLVDGRGQTALGTGQLLEFFTGPGHDFTVGDATAGYLAYGLRQWVRKVAYAWPDYFLVLDTVAAGRPVQADLLFHTDAQGLLTAGDQRLAPGTPLPVARFEIHKPRAGVAVHLLWPQPVRASVEVVAGAESYGPFVRVGTPGPQERVTFLTLLEPLPRAAAASLAAGPGGADGPRLEAVVAPAGADRAGPLQLRVRRPGAWEDSWQLSPFSHGVVRRDAAGRLSGLALADGTRLEDGGTTLVSSSGAVTLDLRRRRDSWQGAVFALQPATVSLAVPAPRQVLLDGQPLPPSAWTFDGGSGQLTLTLPPGEHALVLQEGG